MDGTPGSQPLSCPGGRPQAPHTLWSSFPDGWGGGGEGISERQPIPPCSPQRPWCCHLNPREWKGMGWGRCRGRLQKEKMLPPFTPLGSQRGRGVVFLAKALVGASSKPSGLWGLGSCL